MSRDQIKARARELYRLRHVCNVPMLQACRRIGMATSTPHRWFKEGSATDGAQMDRLRSAILRLAAERGTLPQQYRDEFKALPQEQPLPSGVRSLDEIAQDLSRNVSELQQSLKKAAS